MALSFSTKALITLATMGTAIYAIKRRDANKRRRQRRYAAAPPVAGPVRDESCLFKVFDDGATVGDVPAILEDLEPGLPGAPAELVTDLAPGQAAVAYDYMKHLIAEQGLAIVGSPDTRDEAIGRTLQLIAGGCDWEEGLSPYTHGSKFQRVWTGVGTLGELAESNLAAQREGGL